MFSSINKAVALILHSSPKQGRMWKQALESQGFEVIWGSPEIDILHSIAEFQPQVALIDISEGNFNPYEISRQSAEQYPSSTIVFTNHKRQKIYPSERQWAIAQRAADLIASPKTIAALRDAVAHIVEISNTPISFDPKALAIAIASSASSRRASNAKGLKKKASQTVFSPMQPIAAAFSPLTNIARDMASVSAVVAGESVSDMKQTIMFRGRAIG